MIFFRLQKGECMKEFLMGSGMTILYILIAATLALVARKFLTIPNELFRKILHFILLGAYIPLVLGFDTWWMAAVLAGSLIIVIFPILLFVSRWSAFSAFVVERKKGEFIGSMVLALSMMIFSVSVCWGWMGDRYLVFACIYAWGIGDAFAALIGKRFGKHKIKWKLADHKKSVEGSLAMFICSFFSVFTVLLIRGGLGIPVCFLIAFMAALFCTIGELCTKNGWDTVICPTIAMLIILPLIKLFGGGIK